MGSRSDQVCSEAKSIVVPHSYANSFMGSLVFGAFVVKIKAGALPLAEAPCHLFALQSFH